jgi:putative oxidoreductase
MITALRTAIWNEGFKPATGEHEVLLAAASLALTETGPGEPSLDSAIGSERHGLGWTLAALGAGAAAPPSRSRWASVSPRLLPRPRPAEAPATPEAPPAPDARTT